MRWRLGRLEKIKKLQKAKELKQSATCGKDGDHASVVSMMHKRNNQPSIPTLQAICTAFGITVAKFFARLCDI